MFARHFIDSLDFAYNGKELRGVIPVDGLSRLQDMLASPKGEISYVVRGLLGQDGKPMLELSVEGACQLRCQRCLGGFPHALKLVSRLLLLPEGELDEFSPEENDEADSIPASKHLDVLDMIEEEVLLSLPFAPKHPSGECDSAASSLNQPDKSPFAVLAGLKNR